jgi:multiple sugar transport system ATP-binding protein
MAEIIIENLYKSFISPQEKSQNNNLQNLSFKTPIPFNQSSQGKSNFKSDYVQVLKGINLKVKEGEFMVLVGASGCGKSTLLRIIAGLEEATGGKIWVGDRLVNELPPKARDIAMVFQNYALYPHLKVYENIAFGLRRMAKPSKQGFFPLGMERLCSAIRRQLPFGWGSISETDQKIDHRVKQVADLLQITNLLYRLPKQLSGGQKQRVALGRAIARNPQVFLMDEPLSNLDAKLRAEMRSQIVNLQRQLGVTTIYVTHDQTEAMTMGDRIAVMNKGEIQQIGTPLEIYNQPANKFVAEFIGSPPMNFISVVLNKPLIIVHDLFQVGLPEKWRNYLENYEQQELLLGIRPEHFQVSQAATTNLPVVIDLVEALGNDTYLSVHLKEYSQLKLQVRVSPEYQFREGKSLWLSFNLDKIHLFEPHNGNNLLYS